MPKLLALLLLPLVAVAETYELRAIDGATLSPPLVLDLVPADVVAEPEPTPEPDPIVACDGSELICNPFASVADLLGPNAGKSAVPNRPNDPLTNNKCFWNGGDTDCYPFYETGDCAALEADAERLGGRSQATTAHAALWSPCYDSEAGGARLTYWNDLGSSIQIVRTGPLDETPRNRVMVRYHIKFSPEFFHSPAGTTSSKLGRMSRLKSAACTDDRFMDLRLLKIDPEFIKLGYVLYCFQGSGYTYADNVDITRDRAGHWLEVVQTHDIGAGRSVMMVRDLDTGDMLHDNTIDVPWTESQALRSFYFLFHSSSHKADLSKPSPRLWVKEVTVQ